MENTFYADLLKQIKEKEFKPLRFTIYNFIENDGYVAEISCLKGKRLGMDDFEYISFDLNDDDKTAIRAENDSVINKYNMFSYYIEHNCQKIPECMVFVMKDLGVVICVKLKDFDVKTLKEA